MPKILIIKTSSLGDVVHMLPAIYDAARCIENIQFDWVVEEGFHEPPTWSPYVDKVIPVAIRRWRKSLLSSQTRHEIRAFKEKIQTETYDKVIDSQGLLKSAILTRWVKTHQGVWGYDKQSIREPIACYFYQHKIPVSRELHAITRNRQLLAQALSYSITGLDLNYGLDLAQFSTAPSYLQGKYIIALHGTSKIAKEWPSDAWLQLIQAMEKHHVNVVFPWGNAREKHRAESLVGQSENAIMLPKCGLFELACIISNAQAVIGMDTGLMHIAAALNKQGIGLYPVTQPILTGVLTAGDDNRIENISGNATKKIADIIKKIESLL